MKLSGVYKIQSKINPNRYYIGSGLDMKDRRRNHLNLLRKNKHQPKIQNHYNKYGEDDLVFEFVLGCDPVKEILLAHEQFFIDAYNPYFNICKTADSPMGVKRSEKTRKLQSEKAKNRAPATEETNKKISNTLKERYINNSIKSWNEGLTKETDSRVKATYGMKDKHHTKESIEKIAIHSRESNNPMFGKKRPQWLIDKLTLCNLERIKSNDEKVKRMIILPNRTEIIIEKDNIKINCFSISHTSKIIGVSHQAVSKALKTNKKTKGWSVKKSHNIFYDETILLQNIHLFDENCHPQPELIEMLQTMKGL